VDQAVRECGRVEAGDERADVVDRAVDLGCEGAKDIGGRGIAVRRPVGGERKVDPIAMSRCCAPSWRLRSIRRRSVSAAAWMRACD